MRQLALFACLVLACSPSTATRSDPAPAAGSAEQELMRLEHEWGVALARNDTTFFQRTLADDFLQTGGAHTGTKRDFLASLTGPPQPEIETEQMAETVIRQYGTTAVVTGLVNAPAEGRQYRYTEVWTDDGGQWRAHVGHYNVVAPEGPTAAASDSSAGQSAAHSQ